MNDDLELLASAYLDGDVTADQRAQVDADPALTAEVERLRRVRAVLGADEPPPISVRERHLAAALDAWDRLPEAERTGAARDQTPAGLVTAPPPPSLAARRRARQRTWMLAAAASLVVVLGGGIVIGSLLRDSGASNTATDAPLVFSTEAPAAVEEQAVESRDELAEDLAAADIAADAEAFEPDAESAPAGGAEAPPPEVDLIELGNLDDLATFAADALAATSSPLDAALPASTDAPTTDSAEGFDVRPCDGIDLVVGPASYRGTIVVVGIDEDRNEAVAHTPGDCREIARARLP